MLVKEKIEMSKYTHAKIIQFCLNQTVEKLESFSFLQNLQ